MKAVIPAAGLGTRLLPITKAVPKELLPYQGKPLIQWALEEALSAGLSQFVVIVSPRKGAIRDYLTPLDPNNPLYGQAGLEALEQLLRSVTIEFVEQPEPRGLGEALLRCRSAIAGQPFALLLPDNVFARGCSPLAGLISIHRETRKSCIALYHALGEALRDGAVQAEPAGDHRYVISRVFPKGASVKDASELRPLGRSVLEADICEHLERKDGREDFDEVAGLDGLAKAGRLLGLLATGQFEHVGTAHLSTQ
ncbi:MAG TPA: sugar phosphate nucleotidyltransferase [Blastocatellia bacterium]|nr:sugar phosphate nucleotidyltransferase [Blastocatellia bacterium]